MRKIHTPETIGEILKKLYSTSITEILTPFEVGYGKKKILIKIDNILYSVFANSLVQGYKPSIETCLEPEKLITKKFREVHGNKYDYSRFVYIRNNQKSVIICPIHGEFLQTPSAHKQGEGCLQCVKDKVRMPVSVFKQLANQTHNGKFNYDLITSEFLKKVDEKVAIICPMHGVFYQCAGDHIRGQGCGKCRYMINNKRFEDWEKLGVSKNGIFYIIRCFDTENKEEFIKVGITCRKSIKVRYTGKTLMPYKFEILYELHSDNRRIIWDSEINIKRVFSKYGYSPVKSFNGSKTECFNIELLKDYDITRNEGVVKRGTTQTI